MALRTTALVLVLMLASWLIWWRTDSGVNTVEAPTAGLATASARALPSGLPFPHTSVAMPEHLLMGSSHLKDVVERVRTRSVDGRPLFSDDQAVALAREQQVLFAIGVAPTEVTASPLANSRRLNDGRQWIRYDMQVLAARAEGDHFLLPLQGGMAAQAEIESVSIVEDQYRWSGRLLGHDGGTFHLTQVFDDQYVTGSINTPNGEFLLEAKDGIGWVVESGKEFFLQPDGHDTLIDNGSRWPGRFVLD